MRVAEDEDSPWEIRDDRAQGRAGHAFFRVVRRAGLASSRPIVSNSERERWCCFAKVIRLARDWHGLRESSDLNRKFWIGTWIVNSSGTIREFRPVIRSSIICILHLFRGNAPNEDVDSWVRISKSTYAELRSLACSPDRLTLTKIFRISEFNTRESCW